METGAQKNVTPIDVLVGIGWLAEEKLAAWRKGQIPYLERVVGANLNKISRAMIAFRAWARHLLGAFETWPARCLVRDIHSLSTAMRFQVFTHDADYRGTAVCGGDLG